MAVGVIVWLVLWELFSRLHPRFANDRGEDFKYAVVLGGPPVAAVLVLMLTYSLAPPAS
jgi:hypothetical protein